MRWKRDPLSLGVNPQMTIMAMSLRAAELPERAAIRAGLAVPEGRARSLPMRSLSIVPSRMVTTRGIDSAKLRLWVTTTIVVPCLRFISKNSWCIAVAGRRVEVAGRLVGEEELRREDQRAGQGDALLLAARELAGAVRGARREADLGEQRARARPPSRGGVLPWIRPGIITFSSAVNSGSRWWNWKTKPIVRFRIAASREPEAR